MCGLHPAGFCKSGARMGSAFSGRLSGLERRPIKSCSAFRSKFQRPALPVTGSVLPRTLTTICSGAANEARENGMAAAKKKKADKGKMWQGRFQGGMASSMERLSVSLDFDRKLFREDIAGS